MNVSNSTAVLLEKVIAKTHAFPAVGKEARAGVRLAAVLEKTGITRTLTTNHTFDLQSLG